MATRIAVIGTGYVGLVAAVGLADFGNTVVGVDVDEQKISRLARGIPVIYEPGLQDHLQRNLQAGRLTFTTDLAEAIRHHEVLLIAVGTPAKEDGQVDLGQVEAVVRMVARHRNGYKVVATKSTVPVGTNRWIKEQLGAADPAAPVDVVSNPEFLREGRALYDFFHPDRVVLGFESDRARKVMQEIYRPLYLIETPFIWCDLETAELIKYACNAFLASKITFVNQMANLCEAVGADIDIVARAMGMDGRISPKFLHAGPGYGGSCFPKDTRAVASLGRRHGVCVSLVEETIAANEQQKLRVVEKLRASLGVLAGRTVAVLGLAFKSGTDDVRESPALVVVETLLREGAVIRAHDPKAASGFRRTLKADAAGRILYCRNAHEAMTGADAAVICTEWNEYRNMDLARARSLMRGDLLLDTRNILDPAAVEASGLRYDSFGRPAPVARRPRLVLKQVS